MNILARFVGYNRNGTPGKITFWEDENGSLWTEQGRTDHATLTAYELEAEQVRGAVERLGSDRTPVL